MATEYKIWVRDTTNTGWVNVLQDTNIQVVDAGNEFTSTELDGVLTELNAKIDTRTQVRQKDGFIFIPNTQNYVDVLFDEAFDTDNYSVRVDITNGIDATPDMFCYIITNKTASGFRVQLSSPVTSPNYKAEWSAVDLIYAGHTSGIQSIGNGVNVFDVVFTSPIDTLSYSVVGNLSNSVDAIPSMYAYNISNKTLTGFRVTLSGVTDSVNYKFEWKTFA